MARARGASTWAASSRSRTSSSSPSTPRAWPSSVLHFGFLVAGRVRDRRGERLYCGTRRRLRARDRAQLRVRGAQLALQVGAGVNLDRGADRPDHVRPGRHRRHQRVRPGRADRGRARTAPPRPASSASTRSRSTRTTSGIMLAVPILLALPFALRDGVRRRAGSWPGRAASRSPGLVELLTLSRSGLLGLACGLLVLAVPYWRALLSLRLLVAHRRRRFVVLGLVARLVGLRAAGRSRAASRSATDRRQDPLRPVLARAAGARARTRCFGLGLNTFSVYYEFLTGKTNWGPHSFYVALLAETGLIGACVFALFLAWLLVRLAVIRRAARALERRRRSASAGDGVRCDGASRPRSWPRWSPTSST